MLKLENSIVSRGLKHLRVCAIMLALSMGTTAFCDAVRPNVLLIMADDLGYADIGAFGGEIDTPNLDRLAADGLRFTQFRATPMCSTSRVALMAGMSYPAAGNGSYENVLPLPTALKQAGYRTLMTGKWHAGNIDPRSPRMFDRFFGFLGGMSDCFIGGNDWYEGTKAFQDFDADFYATTAFTDKSIEYMAEAVADEVPFFMFVSYNAPHHPLQAHQETVDKYRGHYLSGYEAIREQRVARQLEMRLIDPDWSPAPAGVEVRRWEDLSDARQVIEDSRMAAYAAMVDEMDQGIGRLIHYLEVSDQLENTLVIFISDNGGDYNNGSILTDASQVPWLPKNNPTSSNGWAWVKNAPFNFYKHASHEGAIAVPCIVHWPAGLAQTGGQINRENIAVTDLYPTLLEIVGTDLPDPLQGWKSLSGKSFASTLLHGSDFEEPSRFLWFNQSRAWIENGMKAVSLYNGPWQLYDLQLDRTEQHDLAMEQQELTETLAAKWHAYALTTTLGASLQRAVETEQKGWGWHRLQMFAPQLVSTFPENSKLTEPGTTHLGMRFSAPVDFEQTKGKFLRLFKVSDEQNPVWEMDPDASHPSQGQRSVCFKDLPPLEPDTQYYVLVDSGAFKVGGKPVGVINDGAYWWRFRTAAE